MASSKYKAYRKILYGEDDQLSKNNKKINNYKARLESSGVDPEKVTDTRNFIEKGLNLEKDQNVLFDLFELLNRPQQALFNAWEAGQEGNDVLEGAWKGLSGQKDTEFKNILKNYGMEDREGKLDLVDALGFAGDVFLDPMDIIPLAGFSKFGDAISAGDSTIKASKNLKTGSDLVMSGIGKGIKGAAKLTDSGIEKALTKADELKGVTNALTGETTKLKYLNPTAKKAANLMPVSKETGELVDNVVGRLQNYKQIKNDISDMFVVPDFLKKATKTQRAEDYRKDITRIKSAKDIKDVSNIIEDFAKKNGENFDDIARDLTLFAESHMNREINNKDLLKLAKSGKLVGYDEVVETLNEIVKKSIPENILDKNPQLFTVKINPDTMRVELGKGFNVFNEFDTSGTTILNKRYTKEQLDRIDKINKRYLSDEGYRNLFDEILGNVWRKNPSDIVDDLGNAVTKNQEIYLDNRFKNIENPDNLPGLEGQIMNPKDYKSIDNKAPVISDDFMDVSENMKPVKNGIIDILNKEVDLGLGTNLAGKYDFLTNDNYIPHTLTEIGKEIRPDLDRIMKSNPTYGNKNLLNSRTRLGSIEEINNDVREIINSIDESKLTPKLVEFKKSNAKFMEDNFISALTNKYVDPKVSIINNASQVSKANQILVRDTFGNAEEMLKLKSQIKDAYDLGDPYEVKELTKKLNQLEDGSAIKFLSPTDKRIPKGYTRLSNAEITQITEKFNVMNKQLGIDGGFGDLTKTISKFGGDVAIDNSILEMFRIGSEDKSITGLSKLYSTYINTFRKWKTASFTFLLNNLVGNSSNLMLSGIGLDEQAKYGQTVLDIITKGENLSMARIAGKQLDDAGNRIADFWELYRSLGFDTSALELNEMPKEIKELFSGERKLSGFKDYMINGIPYFNNMMNNKMDMASRLTVMLKCLDDPKYMGRIGVDNIYDAISRVMFDPKMLTSWEKKYAKNIIPFYTYAKNNLMYHAINLGNNGSKYTKLVKSMQNLQRQATNNNEENLSDFIKNSLYIPIPGYDEKGNYTILRASLPFGQFVEMVNDPLGEIANMLTPAIKAPIENLLNKELYSGRDIETFKGQKSTTIPFLTKKQEKMLSDFTGLDVPAKTVSRLVQGTLDSVKEGNNIVESIGQGLKNTVAMNGNINNDKLFKSYRDIDYLEDVIRQFKQSGNTIPTIAELKRANKNKTIAGLDALFNKYGIK